MSLEMAAKSVIDISIAVLEELELIGEQRSCILAAAAATEVLHRKGYEAAYTLTVGATIYNPIFTAWVKQNGFPKDQTTLDRCEAAGGAQVCIGTNKPKDIHVAVIIPGVFGERHAMSDVTITQANHPEWKIELKPVIAPVTEKFVRGEVKFRPELNGCTIAYEAFPQDREFEKSVLWTHKEALAVLVSRMLRRLEK